MIIQVFSQRKYFGEGSTGVDPEFFQRAGEGGTIY